MNKIMIVIIGLITNLSLAKEIVPVEFIYQFGEINWSEVEKKTDLGKDSDDFITMMCDDDYYDRVEVKFEGTLGKDVFLKTDCDEIGRFTPEYQEMNWFHFDGPSKSYECTVKVKKLRQGKTPLIMTYYITDAC